MKILPSPTLVYSKIEEKEGKIMLHWFYFLVHLNIKIDFFCCSLHIFLRLNYHRPARGWGNANGQNTIQKMRKTKLPISHFSRIRPGNIISVDWGAQDMIVPVSTTKSISFQSDFFGAQPKFELKNNCNKILAGSWNQKFSVL